MIEWVSPVFSPAVALVLFEAPITPNDFYIQNGVKGKPALRDRIYPHRSRRLKIR